MEHHTYITELGYKAYQFRCYCNVHGKVRSNRSEAQTDAASHLMNEGEKDGEET